MTGEQGATGPLAARPGPVTPDDVAARLAGDPVDVAPRLLGARLTATGPDGAVTVWLTEVEAYRGEEDPGSHAFKGRTARNAAMFEPAGAVYVYSIYGMHRCMNLVCGPAGLSRAVLLRAGEVVDGEDLARTRRPAVKRARDLARGPACLTRALGVDRDDDGERLGPAGSRLSLELPAPGEGPDPALVRQGPRTGLSGPGGDGTVYPWRFWLDGDPTVSPYKQAVARRRRKAAS